MSENEEKRITQQSHIIEVLDEGRPKERVQALKAIVKALEKGQIGFYDISDEARDKISLAIQNAIEHAKSSRDYARAAEVMMKWQDQNIEVHKLIQNAIKIDNGDDDSGTTVNVSVALSNQLEKAKALEMDRLAEGEG